MAVVLQSPEDLIESLREDGSASTVSVVDTRSKEEYDQGHIPGAIHLSWEDWCARPPAGLSAQLNEPGYWGRLVDKSNAELSEYLSRLGLSSTKPTVVYANGFLSKGREGRVAWMLLYFGAQDVRLLDGGFNAWLQAGGRTETVSARNTEASIFAVLKDEKRRILLNELKDLIDSDPHLLLLDTRTPEEFEGNAFPYMPRKGTLPGAHLLPYVSIFADKNKFVKKENFARLLPAASNSRIIAFCEVGVRACTVALLHEIYTGRLVTVYDGSMMEWSADPKLPMSKNDSSKNGPRGAT